MEKIIRALPVSYSIDWAYWVPISDIKKDIEKLEKRGATHINIEVTERYWDANIEIWAEMQRLETDEEYSLRIEEENKRKIEKEEWELKNYERLKLKYNK